ncbi:uncharacterized protein MYCFIDRAFT_179163 [Pseudocercospora fijiensis CIRAD86]|uniref:Uncharacterized protein n=1 Tax=Pseudocercospora fijiensis (strain CIRAD86) TaxID=383855 RepID=M3AJL7_PSEFD|nr:uncharacterized protein MYCFIDRAFT_179163 [Pseudocercospora fijiensis CIRAD86]EME77667.1 hypothetical protein MYCFIDRAFT_179163 [Pseudocercospora fijiensis CIRAD86]
MGALRCAALQQLVLDAHSTAAEQREKSGVRLEIDAGSRSHGLIGPSLCSVFPVWQGETARSSGNRRAGTARVKSKGRAENIVEAKRSETTTAGRFYATYKPCSPVSHNGAASETGMIQIAPVDSYRREARICHAMPCDKTTLRIHAGPADLHRTAQCTALGYFPEPQLAARAPVIQWIMESAVPNKIAYEAKVC